MNIRHISMVTIAMAFSASSFAAPPNDNNAHQNRMARQPTSDYWQAPTWPNVSAPLFAVQPHQRPHGGQYGITTITRQALQTIMDGLTRQIIIPHKKTSNPI